MAEVISGVDEVFDAPAFEAALTEWQSAKTMADDYEQRLAELLAKSYADNGWEEHEIGFQVDDLLGRPAEEFAEEFEGDEAALDLNSHRAHEQAREDEAKTHLLETARRLGLGRFAAYGLWLHMREPEIPSRSYLHTRAAETEADFEAVDRFMRAHSGRLLTVFELGIIAGRLADGGIRLNDQDWVVIPTVGTSYGTTTTYREIPNEIPKVIPIEQIRVHPSTIHSIFGSANPQLLDSWDPVLRIAGVMKNKTAFVAGDIAEGPAYIPETKTPADREYYRMIFERAQTVGGLALENTPPTPR